MSNLYNLFVEAKEAVEAADLTNKFPTMKEWGGRLDLHATNSNKDLDIIERWLVYCIGVRRRILEELGIR